MIQSKSIRAIAVMSVSCMVSAAGAPAQAQGPATTPAHPSSPASSPLSTGASKAAASRARADANPRADTGADAISSGSTVEALFPPPIAGGLSADQVARRAAATSYRAAAQGQALAAAEARLDQALVAYFPKLTVTASYTRLSPITPPTFGLTGYTFPVILDNYLLQASLVVPLTDYVLRLSQSYAAASHSTKASELDQKAARLSSALDGRVAYYTWVRATAQVTVAERNLQVTRAHLVDARNGFQVGTASKADVLSAEAQVASAELVVVQERNAAKAAEDRIRIAMHEGSARPFAMGEALTVDEAGAVEDDLGALRAEALDHRLDIRALDETAWSLREQSHAAAGALYPRVDGFGDVAYANPNSRIIPQEEKFRATWAVGVRLTWSPNDAFTANGAASEARARASQTEMQKAVLMDSVKTEVMQAWQALSQARFAVQTTSRSLAAAEESYRVRRELFRNGRATSVELQDSEVALFRASLESVNARANLKIAQARLRHAIGRDVGDLDSLR